MASSAVRQGARLSDSTRAGPPASEAMIPMLRGRPLPPGQAIPAAPLYTVLMKTNAVRLLDSLSIEYEVREYEVDPEDLAAETVALKIGMPAGQVFKTLVARGSQGPCFAVVPGDAEVDLKALAVASGNRKVELVPLKEVQPLTGYIRGGVTVLGAKKAFPVYADKTIELWDRISISAGIRGMQIILRPGDYLRATGAVLADIARSKA